METHTRWKKYSHLSLMTVLVILSRTGFSLADLGDRQVIMPVERVALIPIHFEQEQASKSLPEKTQERLFDILTKVVDQSARFSRVPNHLAGRKWQTPTERKAFARRHEVDAFLHMSVVHQDPDVTLLARFLDINFKIILQEMTHTNVATLLEPQEAMPILKKLLFRLVNRLPIDVSVTSRQGKYITVSGGRARGLFIGQEIRLVRPFLKKIHPVNHSWLEFENDAIGDATVISLARTTAIAKLDRLTSPNRLKPGDGARLPLSPTRVFFTSVKTKPSKQNDLILMNTPLLTTEQKRLPEPLASQESPEPSSEKALKKNAPTSEPIKTEEAVTSKPIENAPKPGERRADNMALINRGLDSSKPANILLHVGASNWIFRGDVKAANSKTPWYLPFNTLGFQQNFQWRKNLGSHMQLRLGNGQHSSSGSFSLISFRGTLFYERESNWLGGTVSSWRLGGAIPLYLLSVKESTFGGINSLGVGLLSGFSGVVKIQGLSLPWDAHLTLTPVSQGKIGYSGKQLDIKSSMDGELSLSFFLPVTNKARWGIVYRKSSQSIKDVDNKNSSVERSYLAISRSQRF